MLMLANIDTLVVLSLCSVSPWLMGQKWCRRVKSLSGLWDLRTNEFHPVMGLARWVGWVGVRMHIPYVTNEKNRVICCRPVCVIKDDVGYGVDTEVCCGRINAVIDWLNVIPPEVPLLRWDSRVSTGHKSHSHFPVTVMVSRTSGAYLLGWSCRPSLYFTWRVY